MLHFSHEKFKELMKIPENKTCFDCDTKSCQWASINNGIFLCTNCSGIHRGLGVEKSYIRSILWDNWNEYQIEFMLKGGNKQLKDLLKEYSFNTKLINSKKFYQTKIMDYYRKYLKSKVEGITFSELPPSKEEAFEESYININTNNENKFCSVGSVNPIIIEENSVTIKDNIKNWIGWAYHGTKDTINNLEIGNKISNIGNSIIEGGNKIIENEKIQNIKKIANDNISYYFNWIIGNKRNNINNEQEHSNNKDEINDTKKYINEENFSNEEVKENNQNEININHYIQNK